MLLTEGLAFGGAGLDVLKAIDEIEASPRCEELDEDAFPRCLSLTGVSTQALSRCTTQFFSVSSRAVTPLSNATRMTFILTKGI